MGKVLTNADVMMCPHGGIVTIVSTNFKVRAGGSFIVRPSDVFAIVGCSLAPGGLLHPCVLVEWRMPAGTTSASGDEALTTDSIGLCKAADQADQGMVLIQTTQTKVSAR